MPTPPEAIVAGHLCLDVIPDLSATSAQQFQRAFAPGRLLEVGAAALSTGGAVSNVMIVDNAAVSSYTVVINPPGVDRIFLHCPGANDTFSADDIRSDLLASARLFHFGYPPLMARMYQNNGSELMEIFQRAKATGVTTCLDMALPDPGSAAGRADWQAILQATLPDVDIFLLALGVKAVGIKLGNRGLYLRTAGEAAWQSAGRGRPADLAAWAGKELWAPCFQVDVAGTTGSGDATIAGFLASLLRGYSAEQAVTMAVAVGACNIEAADALSGIRSWEETQARVAGGWPRHSLHLDATGWRFDGQQGVWLGPGQVR